MRKRLWRLISIMLVMVLGFAGPLGQIAYAFDPLDGFEFNLNTADPYIQFNTSPGAIEVGTADRIEFRVSGDIVDGVIQGDSYGTIQDIIKSYAVELIDVDTSQSMGITMGKGNFTGNSQLEIIELGLEFTRGMLLQDHTYRIEFLTPTIKTLLNRVSQNIHSTQVGDPFTDNVSFELWDSTIQSQVSQNFDTLDNTGAYDTESPTVREFNGSDTLIFEGPMIKMSLGDVTNFSSIDKIELRIEGEWELGVTPGTISGSMNGGGSVTSTFTTLNEMPYVYGISTVQSASGATNDFVLTGADETIYQVQDLIEQYLDFDQNYSDGNVYVVGYSGSNVVGYKLFKGYDTALYYDPQFAFSDVQPDYVGFFNSTMDNDPSVPNVELINTGDDAPYWRYVVGQTSYDLGAGPQTIDFYLTLFDAGGGDYDSRDLEFEDFNADWLPDFSNIPTEETKDSYDVIPVNIFEDNTITLTGVGDFSSVTTTFQWEPDATLLQEFFQSGWIDGGDIGPGSDIEVDMQRFTGSLDDLTLDLIQPDQYEPTSGTAIALYEATSVLDYTDTEMTYPAERSEVTFSLVDPQPTEYVGFDAMMDMPEFMRPTLIFNNPGIAAGEVTASFDQNIYIDNEPPSPWVESFKGFIDGEFKFLVNFNDEVDLSNPSDVLALLSLENEEQEIGTVSILSIEGTEDPYNMQPMEPGDPYRYALVGLSAAVPRFTELVFDATVDYDDGDDYMMDGPDGMDPMEFELAASNELIVKGMQESSGTIEFHLVDGANDVYVERTYEVSSENSGTNQLWFGLEAETSVTTTSLGYSSATFFTGLEDAFGNVMIEREFAELKMETRLDSYLVDPEGNFLVNAELSLLPTDEVPEPISGSAIKWENIVHMHSNDDGKVYNSLYPGTYLAFELQEKDDQGKRTEKAIDMVLTIPVRAEDDPYTADIVLPSDNVVGTSVRAEGASYKEYIIFVESEHLSALQYAAENPDNWELWDVLDMFYVKEVETENDGSFGLYLQEGNYTLVGKLVGESIVEAKSVNGVDLGGTPYTFTVGTAGATITDVEFPPPTLVGTITDSSSNPLSYVFAEFEGDNGFFFEIMTDDTGAFNAVIDVPGTYALTAVRSDWDVDGAGQLYVSDTGFASATIEQADIDAIEAGTGQPVNMSTVALPDPNHQVAFVIDGNAISQGDYSSIMLVEDVVEGEFARDYHIPSQAGTFDLYLPVATYNIEEFNYRELWVEPDPVLTFDITELSPTTPGTTNIDLSDYYNAVITVLDEDSNHLEGYRVETFNQWNGWWRGSVTNALGKAYFNFEVPEEVTDEVAPEDALIQLQSYVYKDKWYDLYNQNLTFTVNHTNDGTNKATYTLVVSKPNFTGSLYSGEPDGSGNYLTEDLVQDGSLNVKRISTVAGEWEEWFWIWVDFNGDFAFVLPQVGEYLIESGNDHQAGQWFEIGKRIDVIDDGGRLVVVDPATQSPITMPMDVGPQAPNFTGYLYKTGETPYLTSVTDPNEYYVAMIVREKGIDQVLYDFEPWRYEYRIHVDQDGSFSFNLDPSASYEVWAVETSRGWFEFSTPIDITVAQNQVITPPVPNFNGAIKGFGGVDISNLRWGRVELENLDRTEWFGTELDDTGNFGMALTDGETYIIREYWYEVENEPNVFTHNYVRLNRAVTIGTNSSDIVLAPNFFIDLSDPSGTIIEAPTEDYENYFNANIRPKLELSDFTQKYPSNPTKAQEEYENYQFNPWEYTTWVEGKYNSSNGHIEFYTYIEDGPYELMDIHGHNLNLEVNKPFTLNGAESEGVVYDTATASYTLELAYSANVTGTITEDSIAVPKAWVNFMRTDLDWEDYTSRRWFGTQTNTSGEFSLNLPSDEIAGPTGDDEATAQYKLEGYHTEGQWVGNYWEPGKWTPVGYNFLIDAEGQMTDMSGNPLDSITLAPNVKGEIYKIFSDNDNAEDFHGTTTVGEYAKAKEAWINIWPYDSSDADYEIPWEDWEQSYWTHVDANGQFSLMLDPGEYIVTEVGMPNFWYRPELVFEIDSNGDLVANSAVEDGILKIKPELPNFSGTAYEDSAMTDVLQWGWIMIKPADADEHDWSNTIWLNTDRNGEFAAKLSDGDWKVVEMGNYGFWERMNIPFAVAGSTITSTAPGIVTNGEVNIYPPDPNVVGIVKNKSGTQIQTNAWLTIKPADANEYDWENAIWTEYKLQSDDTYRFKINLEPGDYKVVEVGSWDFFYHTDVRFTVGSDLSVTSSDLVNGLLEVAPPQPNFTGTVYGDTDGDQVDDDPIGNGWIGIARYEDGVQVTMEGEDISSDEYKDEWSNLYWQYTRWTETNASGKFEMNLPVGSYQVIGVGGQGVWYQPRLEFDIAADEITILDISEPGPNVTITVTGVPTEMQATNYAWLDVFRTVGTDKFFEPVEFTGKDGNDFVFEGNLASGSYEIGFFGTEYGGIEIDDETMTVSGTTTKTVNVGEETGKQMIEGQIITGTTNIGQKAWIKIEGVVDGSTVTKKTQTNASGEFKFKLPENTDWTVTEISLKEGYLLLPDSTDYQFNSGSAASPSALWEVDIESLLQ